MPFLSFQDVFSSRFGGDETGGALEIVTLAIRRAGEDEGRHGDGVECWDGPCIVYRPDDPDPDSEEDRCQVLSLEASGRPVVIGGRDPRLLRSAGALNKGDVAVVGWGRGKVLLKKTGAVTLYQDAEGEGGVDAYMGIDVDGTIVIGNQWGAITIQKDALTLTFGANQIAISADTITQIAQTLNSAVAVNKLWMGAKAPLMSVPTVPITGTPTPAFASLIPTPNVMA